MSSQRTNSDTAVLGDIQPNGSRQLGRQSSVCLAGDRVVAGLTDGTVAAFDDTLQNVWQNDDSNRGSVVTLESFAGALLAGERGADGEVHLHDRETGEVRWRYRTADDIGSPQQETRFFLPFVVDIETSDDGERAFVAARRYERDDDGTRTFRSVVYAFDPSGTIAWQFDSDASPISLVSDGDRVAIAFNRCPGNQTASLVVLDAESGDEQRRWNPPGSGDRRVGDVALTEDSIVVTSHADYRGYCLDTDGVRWAVDLGRPVERGDETVYAYPNHVHATRDGVVFVTGNTYPENGRETDARHPNEHTAVGVTPDGDVAFTDAVGGFSHEITAAERRVAVPVAQHFRERDPVRHGVRVYDVENGRIDSQSAPGVVTAVAADSSRLLAIEEPVSYHDDGEHHGAYRLRRIN